VAIPDASDLKNALRSTMRRVLRENAPDSLPVRRALEEWLSQRPGLRTIAIYAALPGEPDLAELTAAHAERRWVYPRVDGDALVFHHVTNPANDLTPGAFGIFEPSPTLAILPLEQIDAFICPGLAFDSHGGRLGRGKGFYDRMLSTARADALKIGVCFACQMVPDTHSETHDILMDAVVTNFER
jgi:5-formyltetrahydrofolate cyclo-ligase